METVTDSESRCVIFDTLLWITKISLRWLQLAGSDLHLDSRQISDRFQIYVKDVFLVTCDLADSDYVIVFIIINDNHLLIFWFVIDFGCCACMALCGKDGPNIRFEFGSQRLLFSRTSRILVTFGVVFCLCLNLNQYFHRIWCIFICLYVKKMAFCISPTNLLKNVPLNTLQQTVFSPLGSTERIKYRLCNKY